MKQVCLAFGLLLICGVVEASKGVYLISKRQVSDSTHTHVALFFDRDVRDLSDCETEVQRGYRGRWRYFHHKYPKIAGTAEKLNYYCVKADLDVNAWYSKAPYDYMYQFDLRSSDPKIKEMSNYATCLKDLRRRVGRETPRFFCAKLSQKIVF